MSVTTKTKQNIPKGWQKKQIKDLLDYERPDKYIVESDRYIDKGVPVLTANKSFILGYTDEKDGVYENIPAIIFDDFTTYSKFVDFPFKVKSSAIKILKEKNTDVDLRFVYEKMKSINFPTGSHKRYYISQYQDMEVIVPPLSEQKKIAEILGAVDEEIQKTDKIIAATEKLKRGLMQQLFSRGIGHTKFKKTKIGEIPIAWDLKKLQYVCDFTTGRLNSNKAVKDGQYPFFTCAQETYQIDTYSFDQKAILLAGNNAAGKYSVKYFEGKFDAYQRTYVISVKDEKILDYYFLKEFLNTQLNELRNYSVGTNTQFLTIKLLNNLLMPLPDIDEQKKITDILSSVNAKIFTNQKLKSKLALLKKGLMQDLLSGTKRVKV